MRIIKATEVKFEALGREHTLYTESLPPTYIYLTVAKVSKTAHVSSFRQVEIPDHELQENNLQSINKWYDSIESDFSHISTKQ